MQVGVHRRTSRFRPFQTKRALTGLQVDHAPGWARLCIKLKTSRRNDSVTTGLTLLWDASQRSVMLPSSAGGISTSFRIVIRSLNTVSRGRELEIEPLLGSRFQCRRLRWVVFSKSHRRQRCSCPLHGAGHSWTLKWKPTGGFGKASAGLNHWRWRRLTDCDQCTCDHWRMARCW